MDSFELSPPGTFGVISIFFALSFEDWADEDLKSPFLGQMSKSPLSQPTLGPPSGSDLWLSPHSVREGAKTAFKWGLQYGSQSGQTDVPSKSV